MKFTTSVLLVATIVTLKGVESGITSFSSSDTSADMVANTNRLPIPAVKEGKGEVDLSKDEKKELKKVEAAKRNTNKKSSTNSHGEKKPNESKPARMKEGGILQSIGDFVKGVQSNISGFLSGFKELPKLVNGEPKKPALKPKEPKKEPPKVEKVKEEKETIPEVQGS